VANQLKTYFKPILDGWP